MERSVSRSVARVDIGMMLEEHGNGARIAGVPVQRRHPVVVAGIDVRAMGDEDLEDRRAVR